MHEGQHSHLCQAALPLLALLRRRVHHYDVDGHQHSAGANRQLCVGHVLLLVGPTAGTNSVVLAVTPATGTWTAITNAPWLHLTVANQSGTGSTNVVFSYDANSSATRSNTLTIAGQKLTIIQAGSTYVAAGSVTSLVPSGLGSPCCGAVDSAGNLYVPEQSSSTIAEWVASNNTLIRPVSGFGEPCWRRGGRRRRYLYSRHRSLRRRGVDAVQ